MSDITKKFEKVARARQACVLEVIDQKIDNEKYLLKIVRQMCSRFGVDCVDVKKSHLMNEYKLMLADKKLEPNSNFEKLVTKRRVRTISGVSVISVMTKPMGCPGNCTYCPSPARMPKSYLDNQPAAMRGVMNDFDPFEQVRSRLLMLEKMGHDISKNEVIVLGGTFSAHPVKYQELFIKRCFDAFNSFNEEQAKVANTLEEAKKINETAKCRMIGLTIETRPDYVTSKEAKWLRYLGVTRVELGVQSVFDDVLLLVKRGHDVEQTKKATKILRQAGFKIVYHVMPGLPGSSMARDVEMFDVLFSDPGFYPDHLKIYPTVVLEDSHLYDVWRAGHYVPYNEKDLIKLFKKVKPSIPPWVRIVRLMRDIPSDSVVAGAKSSNLRQEMNKMGIECNCIRCREPKGEYIKDIELLNREYDVSGGKEVFLSYESPNKKKILALVRLFLPNGGANDVVGEIYELEDCALIRELHTYGNVVGVDKKGEGSSQHRGLGKKLMLEAEQVAKKFGYKKMAVISGVGVREYYRKLGYKLEGEYMVKSLV